MPPFEEMEDVEPVTVWPYAGADVNGRVVPGPPRQLQARVVFRRTGSLDATGETVAVDGRMAVNGPDADLPDNSLLWPGPVTSLPSGTSFGDEAEGLYQLKARARARSIHGVVTRREFDLVRYTDLLPAELPAAEG